jgi:hypothetical protein
MATQFQVKLMFGLLAARNKERERFYLLPGMGGRALKRKRKLMLQWSIAAGLLVSGIVASLLYLMYQHSAK